MELKEQVAIRQVIKADAQIRQLSKAANPVGQGPCQLVVAKVPARNNQKEVNQFIYLLTFPDIK